MKYLLNIERIDELVKEFVESVEGASFTLKVDKKPYLKKQFIITIEGKRGYLNCHITKGRVAFDIQGPDDTLKEICENCKQHIISESTIPLPDRKCIKVDNVEEQDWNDFVDELKREISYVVEEKNLNNSALVASYSITDQYGAVIHLHYYSNGTVYAQGAISTLFVTFQTFLIGFLSPVPENVKDEFLKISNIEDDIFSQDLGHYFHHPEHIAGTVIETLVKTSFVIANSACILPDYGAMTYGIFKALEALLYRRIRLGRPTQNDFTCFKYDKPSKTGSWQVNTFDSKPALKAALLHGYEFYCSNRHTTFHVDPTIVTTRLLEKDEAIGLIIDTIDKMNDILDNW